MNDETLLSPHAVFPLAVLPFKLLLSLLACLLVYSGFGLGLAERVSCVVKAC
jgi:hypothetical protein